MYKKTLVVVTTLGLIVMGSSIKSEAQEPLYDQEGNLILDVEQEQYQDLSTQQQQESVPQEKPPNTAQQKTPEEPSNSSLILDAEPSTEIKEEIKVEEKPKAVNNVAATNTETGDSTLGLMIPASSTYMAGGSTAVATKGNSNISKVEIDYSVGLPANSWSIAGDTLTFDTKKLDQATSGVYTFKVFFANGTDAIYELKVLENPKVNDYWQQNITSYSKDARSNTHRDLELISSSVSLSVTSITIGQVSVPSSQYKIIGGTIIISKSFLSQLDSSPRARVTVTYNNGLVVDFSLAINDEVEKGNSSEQVDC